MKKAGKCDGKEGGAGSNLQEFLAPIIQTLIAVGCLLRICTDRVLQPFLKEFRVLFENQKLTQNCICLLIKVVLSTHPLKS